MNGRAALTRAPGMGILEDALDKPGPDQPYDNHAQYASPLTEGEYEPQEYDAAAYYEGQEGYEGYENYEGYEQAYQEGYEGYYEGEYDQNYEGWETYDDQQPWRGGVPR